MKRRFIACTFCCLLLMACPQSPHRVMSSYKIEYSSLGKGGSEYIQLKKRKLTYIKNQQDTLIRELKRKQYVKLYPLFLKIPLDSLSSLSVPSKRHQFDGALASTLTITDIYAKQWISPTFDHDNPPEELKAFIDFIKILTKK